MNIIRNIMIIFWLDCLEIIIYRLKFIAILINDRQIRIILKFDNWSFLTRMILFYFWINLRNSFWNQILLLFPIILIFEHFILIVSYTLLLMTLLLNLISVWFLNWLIYSEGILWKTKSIHTCIEYTLIIFFNLNIFKFLLIFWFFNF